MNLSNSDLKLLRDLSQSVQGRRRIVFLLAPKFISDPESTAQLLKQLVEDQSIYKDLLARLLSESAMKFASNPNFPKAVKFVESQIPDWEGF